MMNHNQASLLDHLIVANLLGTNPSTGLTTLEARERLKKYGSNKLDHDQDQRSAMQKCIHEHVLLFLKQFLNPLIQLLLICVLISAIIGEYGNSISVVVSILIVCTISFVQERRADKSLEKLNCQLPTTCKVVREGQTFELPADYLVPGDIVQLTEGQRVPADVRLFDLYSLIINEANLTGENQSQAKTGLPLVSAKELISGTLSGRSTASPPPTPAPPPLALASKLTLENSDTLTNSDIELLVFQNLALMGTLVESGHSKGIVISTGKSTKYGEVFSMLKTTIQPQSPLQNNIDQLSIHLVIISCVIITFVSIIGIVRRRPILDVAYYALSLAVTAIPEGLPVVVAVIMTLGVIRLSKQKTIVKSLTSIETLGCIQVLCADKTGTLTQTNMTLTDIVTSELHSLSSNELDCLHDEDSMNHVTFNKLGGKMYSISRLMEVGSLCNNSSIELNPRDGQPTGRLIGQATECAILEAAIRLGFGDSRTKFKRLGEIPFAPSSRRMVVQCQRQDLKSSGPMYYVKGAWEEILKDCVNYYECGLVKPKCDEMWLEYARICTTLGSQGLRVLALATGNSLDQLTFVGLIGIKNALRDGIVDTVGKLRNDFHIDVKMITGDSRATAVAVGRQLGLVEGLTELEEDNYIMSGEQLQRILSTDVDQALKAGEILNKLVFYRMDPIQKANIIAKLQDLNKVVAMVGDGVNDVIGLKRSNLSIVLGSGADVCKEIADVIVVDDDLSVLLASVVEGKGIYHKIHSFLAYQISISLTLVILVAISFGASVSPPFTVIQLLFINILADGPPAQSLGLEKINEQELCLWPRDVSEPLLSCRLLGTLLILTTTLLLINGGLYWFLLLDDSNTNELGLVPQARALLFACFIYCSIFAAFSLRSKVKTSFETRIHGNKQLLLCCLVIVLISVLIIQIDGLNQFFDTEWVSYQQLICVFLYAALILLIMDGLKVLVRLLDYMRRILIKAANHSNASECPFNS